MPLDHDPWADVPLPPPHRPAPPPAARPRLPRRVACPMFEAQVARIWTLRRHFEAEGYAFPGHPRPPVPRLLRSRYPEEAAQDDLRAGGVDGGV